MTAKKHDASTRFRDLVKKYRRLAPAPPEDPEWKDPMSILHRLPLSCAVLPGNPLDDAIAVAFTETGFDVNEPLQWKLLLGLFCIAHFGEWKKLAAPKIWTAVLLEQLNHDAAEVRSRLPDLSDEAIAKSRKYTERYRNTYGKYSINYLRERLADARKSHQESEKLLNTHLTSVRRLFAFMGREWTSENEAQAVRSFKSAARKVSPAP
jgi:hypothetical protein